MSEASPRRSCPVADRSSSRTGAPVAPARSASGSPNGDFRLFSLQVDLVPSLVRRDEASILTFSPSFGTFFRPDCWTTRLETFIISCELAYRAFEYFPRVEQALGLVASMCFSEACVCAYPVGFVRCFDVPVLVPFPFLLPLLVLRRTASEGWSC